MVELDYAEKGCNNYLIIICALTGFMQAYKTPNKGTDEAIKCLRTWSAQFGRPYTAKSDSGPAFRLTWEEELAKLGVSVSHSSCYNPQSNGLVERSVRTLKARQQSLTTPACRNGICNKLKRPTKTRISNHTILGKGGEGSSTK